MTATGTRTAAFTITDARYVGARSARTCGCSTPCTAARPWPVSTISSEEAALLLRDGYLRTVDYGFRDDDRERVEAAFALHRDRRRLPPRQPARDAADRPPPSPDTASAPTSLTRAALPRPQRRAAGRGEGPACPFSRVGGAEPATGLGHLIAGHGYGRNGVGVTRDLFIAS